jgi:5-bromo-4-chloroindolyl phosphate hydrolysis protein
LPFGTKIRDEYISKIKKANEEIQNAKISADLDNIEAAVKKIFDYVGKHTEQAKQLDHFINFYLPTTFKLLEAYKKYDQTDRARKEGHL